MRDRPQDLENGIEAFQNEDYSKAFSLLMPLAEVGLAQAQCYIASMYHGGLGVPVDGSKAVKWYRKAAELRDTASHISAVAYNNLGTIYSTGMPGVSADHRLARKCWRQDAELGFEMIPPPREIW
jgi:TPR repeat protein